MAKSQRKATPPTSFEILGTRIQKIIGSPGCQRSREAIIFKQDDELQDDWANLIDAIAETDEVRVTFQEDKGVRVSWDAPANI